MIKNSSTQIICCKLYALQWQQEVSSTEVWSGGNINALKMTIIKHSLKENTMDDLQAVVNIAGGRRGGWGTGRVTFHDHI